VLASVDERAGGIAMTAHAETDGIEELARRQNAGIDVRLCWSRTDGSLTVFVTDTRDGKELAIPVANRSPLDVYQSPYAYTA
jgi:hypothetical protein